jgi:molybdopterin-guanine dinucleotide biosynthesis protein A
MGRDKAGLVIGGQPLWQRQLSTLQATGAAEIFISGHLDGPYAATELEIVTDEAPGLGPLSGLAAALRHAHHDMLLVLAIDLPAMPADYLRTLLEESAARACGIVPQGADWPEPLAAVYPRACVPLVERALLSPDRSMQRFVREAAECGLIALRPIEAEEQRYFQNVNAESDLPPL